MALQKPAADYAWAWGKINAGVNRVVEGQPRPMSTQEIFRAVQNFAEEFGFDTPPGMFQAVNELRHLAVAERNAGVAFMAAPVEARLTTEYAPPDINARDIADRNIIPEYLARFDMTHRNADGSLEMITRTMKDTWRPGMTVGDVRQAVYESATGLANDYGIDLVSTDNIRVVEV